MGKNRIIMCLLVGDKIKKILRPGLHCKAIAGDTMCVGCGTELPLSNFRGDFSLGELNPDEGDDSD